MSSYRYSILIFVSIFLVIELVATVFSAGVYYRDIHPFRVEGDVALYLAFDQAIRKIPDNETLASLGYSYQDLSVLTSEQFSQNKYVLREDIDSFYLGSVINPDEVHRIQKQKISILQDMPLLVKNLTKLGDNTA